MAAKQESIGQRIARLRQERGLTQRALAEDLVHVTYAYVSRIEGGSRQPSLRAMREMANRLGVTALYLETGSDRVRCPHCGRIA